MRASIVFVLTSLSAAGYSQNLLINGDFELSVPNNGTDNGWTAGNNDGAGGWRSEGGNPGGMFILNNGGSSSTNPFIYQTVTGLTPGSMYIIGVDYQRAYFSSGNGVNDFGIEADGHLWEFNVYNDNTWRTVSVSFVASGSSVTVMFTGERHGDTTPLIDNASLEAVPEPASLAVLSLGALALIRRKR